MSKAEAVEKPKVAGKASPRTKALVKEVAVDLPIMGTRTRTRTLPLRQGESTGGGPCNELWTHYECACSARIAPFTHSVPALCPISRFGMS